MSLVTLEQIKLYMNIPEDDTSQDALLTMFQAAVEQQVLNYCETSFTPTVVTGEILDATRADIITQRNTPIISVQGVYLGVDVDGSGGIALDDGRDYYHDKNAIRLRAAYTSFGRGYTRVDYTYGYSSVPPDVQLAVCIAVKATSQRKKRNSEGVSSRSKQDESESYRSAWDPKTGLPVEVVSMLAPYRVSEFPNLAMAQRNL